MLYQEWLKIWLENYVRPSSKQRTYSRYSEIVDGHLTPKFGEFELQNITPYEIQCFVTELLKTGNLKTGQGLSASYVNSIITVIQNTLRSAYSLGLVEEYIGNKIKRPRVNEKRVECFTMRDQKKIEKYILDLNQTKFFGVLLCLYTGLRIGELMALEWSDIDMTKGEIQISKTCYYGKNNNDIYGRITDVPKTASSIRVIPIPKRLIPYLKDANKKSRSTHIVSNGTKPISIRSYQRSFSRLLQKLGIEHHGFHSLRHTFATRALECGMDVKTLSEILGHKSPTITLNRYSHSMMEHKKEMMNRLGRIL